jgi:hypothetical protein
MIFLVQQQDAGWVNGFRKSLRLPDSDYFRPRVDLLLKMALSGAACRAIRGQPTSALRQLDPASTGIARGHVVSRRSRASVVTRPALPDARSVLSRQPHWRRTPVGTVGEARTEIGRHETTLAGAVKLAEAAWRGEPTTDRKAELWLRGKLARRGSRGIPKPARQTTN